MADQPPKTEGAAPPALQFSIDDSVANGVYANLVLRGILMVIG